MASPDRARPTRDGVAIGVAVGAVGIAFGVLARSSGLSVEKACALSLFVFTGASQFAALSVLGAGGSVLSALGSALLLGSRNALYGAVVARWFDRPGLRHVPMVQLVIDESTGVGAAQPDANDLDRHGARRGFLAAGLSVYVCWNLGTLLGALLGDVIGDPMRLGMDAVFPAAFMALLVPHLREPRGRAAALSAAAVSLVALPVLPAGLPILVAAFVVVPIARREGGRT